METEVLQENDLATSSSVDGLLDLGTNTVVQELDLIAEKLLELGNNGSKRVLLVDRAVGTAEVGHEDDSLGIVLDGVLDGGESTDDTLVVGDLLVGVKRDVEVDLERYVRRLMHASYEGRGWRGKDKKHTLIKTRLSARSTSVMANLLESDIVIYLD